MTRTAIPARALQVTAQVERFAGETAHGPRYDTAVEVPVALRAGRRLVRSAQGDETVAETTLYTHPKHADLFAAESRVTVDGQSSTVLEARTHRNLRGDASLVEVVVR